MKKEFTLKMLKYTLGLVLLVGAMSCSEDLNLTEFNGLDDAIVAQGVDSRSAAAKGGSGSVSANVTSWSTDFPTVGCAGVELSFKLNGVGGRETKIAELVAGNYIPLVQKNASDASTVLEYKPTYNTVGSYTLYYQVGGQNGSNGFKPFTFVIEDCNTCPESFNYVKNNDGSYTFTYIPAETMNNALVVFTIAQNADIEGFDGWSRNGQTVQKYMDLVACETYTWTVFFTAKCSGQSQNSNVWTDFKINPTLESSNSKKNDNTPNIVLPCSN